MKPSIATAPLLLFLWQAAPVTTVRDSTGRTHVTLGFGAGRYEDRVYSCNGQLVSAAPATYQTGGVALDHWASRHARVTLFGGAIASQNERFAGPFGGLSAAYEGRPFGIGGGLAMAPIDSQPVLVPSVYLRVGSLNRLHVRADLFNPEAAFGTTGIFRLGLASNYGLLRGPRWFAGFSVPLDARGNRTEGAFGELALPVSKKVDLLAGAAWRNHAQYGDWGVSAGVRVGFGK